MGQNHYIIDICPSEGLADNWDKCELITESYTEG